MALVSEHVCTFPSFSVRILYEHYTFPSTSESKGEITFKKKFRYTFPLFFCCKSLNHFETGSVTLLLKSVSLRVLMCWFITFSHFSVKHF